MRRCHFPRFLALLFATLALWPLSAAAQETCVGDQCSPQGSIYRYITDFTASGTVSANTVADATHLVVNSLADLRKAKVPTSNITIFAERKGFLAVGDGGDARYYYDFTSKCADDSGSCIAPNTGQGRWVLIPQYPLNPIIWGKLPNPLNFYVATTGTDSGYCLSLASACKTLAYAVTQTALFNPGGGQIIVNVGTGTFTGNLAVSGTGYGFLASTPFISSASVPMLVISGNGSGNTKILGQPSVGGRSFAYAILAENHAVLGVQNLSVEADTAGGCSCQSDLYVERSASMYIISDVQLLGALGNLITMEDGARMYVNPGLSATALTLAGNATGNGIAIDGQSFFWADTTIAIANSPVFTGGFLFAGDYGSVFKLRGNPAVTSGATISGARFLLGAGTVLEVATPPATWPGTIGTADYGGRYQASDNASCMGGTAGCNNTTASTALGAGGSYAMISGSSTYGGEIQITMGANALAAGTVQLGFSYLLTQGSCTFAVAAGTGSWNIRAAVSRTSGPETATGIAVDWDNNGVSLTNGLTYGITYVCSTAH